jgi:hypothetical protein
MPGPRPPRILLPLLLLIAAVASAQPDPAYWRLDAVKAQLATWAAEHPSLVHVTSLGLSGQGEPIPVVCISDQASEREAEPALLIHGAQHANECNGTGAVMATIERLLAGYGTDPLLTARVDELELWFVPIVNVDGHRHVFAGPPEWADWRKTLRDNNDNGAVDFPDDGVDLNRNWDWRWDQYDQSDPASQKYKGPSPFSEVEARALRDFVLRERPLVVVDYHSPVTISWHNQVFYIWPGSPDFDLAGDLAHDWAAATRDRHGDPYHAIYAFDTLPKEQCWVHGNTGILSFLVEIEDQCWFTGATVDSIAHRVARGSMTLLDAARMGPGLAVEVVDALTGEPLVADIAVVGLESGIIGPRQTDAANGRFERLLPPGTHELEVTRRDYELHTESVTVGSGWTEVTVLLQPITTAVEGPGAGFALEAPNPLRAGQRVRLRLPATAMPATVDLFDVRGHRIARLATALPVAGTHALALPRDLADGVYLLQVRSGGEVHRHRVVYVH